MAALSPAEPNWPIDPSILCRQDLMSFFGGSLGGIEAAIESALRDAEQRLRRSAAQLGADHVLNVSIALETVSDKAQAILMTGTAVQTRAPKSAAAEGVATTDWYGWMAGPTRPNIGIAPPG